MTIKTINCKAKMGSVLFLITLVIGLANYSSAQQNYIWAVFNPINKSSTNVYVEPVGSYPLNPLFKGDYNIATGFGALINIDGGSWNTANGGYALYKNKIGYANTAVGYGSLYSNTTGYWNTASSVNGLYNNLDGVWNTASGVNALYSNVSGVGNTASGVNSLYTNMYGNTNTAYGIYSLAFNTAGNNNTAIGYFAVAAAGQVINNATAIGANAVTTASNTVVLGDANVTNIGGYSNWFNLSDGRFKKNIKKDVHGLDFIMQLQPVSYNVDVKKLNNFLGVNENKAKMEKELKMNKEEIAKMKSIEDKAIAEKEAIRYDGFIAQDVEKVAKSVGYDFSGVIKPANEKDHYKISYSDFVVPLVKGMQEQQNKIQELEKQIEELKKMISNKESVKVSSIELSDKNSIVLNQNVPNPFANQTTITYSVPQNVNTAQIAFYDAKGSLIKTANLSKGAGQLNVFGNDLTSGTYTYSLIVDGKATGIKKLVKE